MHRTKDVRFAAPLCLVPRFTQLYTMVVTQSFAGDGRTVMLHLAKTF
jgi:hypothetical protein